MGDGEAASERLGLETRGEEGRAREGRGKAKRGRRRASAVLEQGLVKGVECCFKIRLEEEKTMPGSQTRALVEAEGKAQVLGCWARAVWRREGGSGGGGL